MLTARFLKPQLKKIINNLARGFSESSKQAETFRTLDIESNGQELIINVPKENETNFSFDADFGKICLYENFRNNSKPSSFIPLPKTNIVLFSTLSYLYYNTIFFQPTLLLALFLLNKHLMLSMRGYEVIKLYLTEDLERVYLTTYIGSLLIPLGKLHISKRGIYEGISFYELKVNKGFKVYLMANGTFLNKELVEELFTGEYSRCKLNFLE